MGNWMTVNIEGTCEEKDVGLLKKALNPGKDFEYLHCLSDTNSFLGLSMWAAEEINAAGNLAERDYDSQGVADQLRELAAIAPSLTVKVHCGGENESLICIATVTLEAGVVSIGEPEVKAITRKPIKSSAATSTYAETMADLF